MRKLSVFSILTIVAVFFLFSCQKDNMEQMDNQIQQSNIEQNQTISDKDIPELTIDTSVTTEATSIAAIQKVQKSMAQSRNSTLTLVPDELVCGSEIWGNTQDGDNQLNRYNNPCYNGSSSFDGKDLHYYLVIDCKQQVTIKLSELYSDLDVFLFTLDSQGYPRYCKGKSTKSNTQTDIIKVWLDPGVYLVSVDGYKSSITSSFKLSIDCYGGNCAPTPTDCCSSDPLSKSWVQDELSKYTYQTCGVIVKCCYMNGQPVIDIAMGNGCSDASGTIFDCYGNEIAFYGGIGGIPRPYTTGCKVIYEDNGGGNGGGCNGNIFYDDFEGKRIGNRISQYSNWSKHPNISGNSAKLVTTNHAGTAMKLDNSYGTQESALFTVNTKDQNTYEVKFRIYTDQHSDSRIFLYDQHFNTIKSLVFAYPTYKGRWIDVKYVIDQQNNHGKLYIEGQFQNNFSISSSARLSKVSFHTKADGKKYKFWIDKCEVECI